MPPNISSSTIPPASVTNPALDLSTREGKKENIENFNLIFDESGNILDPEDYMIDQHGIEFDHNPPTFARPELLSGLYSPTPSTIQNLTKDNTSSPPHRSPTLDELYRSFFNSFKHNR